MSELRRLWFVPNHSESLKSGLLGKSDVDVPGPPPLQKAYDGDAVIDNIAIVNCRMHSLNDVQSVACFGDSSWHELLNNNRLCVGYGKVLDNGYGVGFRDMDGIRSRDVVDDGHLDGVWYWTVDGHWYVLGDLNGVGFWHMHGYWTINWYGDLIKEIQVLVE